MERQINVVCNLTLEYIKCQLMEDMIDVHVKIRTLRGTHTLKEDWDYCSLKFKPWGAKAKLFKTLQVRLSKTFH